MGTTWDFTGGSLPAGATLTRASAGRYFDASGVLQSATTNTARFDHNPKTPFALRGLLYEGAVTEYAQYTRDLSAWYTPNHCFRDTPAGTAPDGSSSFAYFSDDFAYDEHSVVVPLSVLSNGDAPRISFFVQNPHWPTEGNLIFNIGNGHTDGTQVAQASYNTTTGALGSLQYGNGSGAPGSGVMVDCGGGTFWVSMKFGDAIADNSIATINIQSHFSSGDPSFGLYLWDVNLKKAGTEFDSDVPNASSGTTSRSADVLNITLGTGATQVVVTFDDASTQTITGLSAGSYNVSTALNRPWIKTIVDNSSGGGSTYTLAGATGFYALTGQAGGLKAARKLPGAQGSYGHTGYSGALVKGSTGAHTLAGATGFYNLTGKAAGLAAARKLAGAQGSYGLTGQASGLSRGLKLNGTAGAYTLTGKPATFHRTYALAGESGIYILTGGSAILFAPGRVDYAQPLRRPKVATALPVTGTDGRALILGTGRPITWGGAPLLVADLYEAASARLTDEVGRLILTEDNLPIQIF